MQAQDALPMPCGKIGRTFGLGRHFPSQVFLTRTRAGLVERNHGGLRSTRKQERLLKAKMLPHSLQMALWLVMPHWCRLCCDAGRPSVTTGFTNNTVLVFM